MTESQTVYILTRTIQDRMMIIAVFKTQSAMEARILNRIRANDLDWLKGLGMETHTVMES